MRVSSHAAAAVLFVLATAGRAEDCVVLGAPTNLAGVIEDYTGANGPYRTIRLTWKNPALTFAETQQVALRDKIERRDVTASANAAWSVVFRGRDDSGYFSDGGIFNGIRGATDPPTLCSFITCTDPGRTYEYRVSLEYAYKPGCTQYDAGKYTNATPPSNVFRIAIPGPPEDVAVELVAFDRKVEVQVNESGWQPVEGPVKLHAGDRVHTGFKATAKLVFPDGSIVDVQQMSLLLIESFTKTRTRLLLNTGAVKAQVNRSTGAAADFHVKTPTTTAGVRGTVFGVLFDPVALVSVVTVAEGTVTVTPNSGAAVDVTAGSEVQSTDAAVSEPAKPGRAGTPAGGISRAKATALVLKAIGKAAVACGLEPRDTQVGMTPIASGWDVTVTTTIGLSRWSVVKKKLAPLDDAAKSLKKRCKGM